MPVFYYLLIFCFVHPINFFDPHFCCFSGVDFFWLFSCTQLSAHIYKVSAHFCSDNQLLNSAAAVFAPGQLHHMWIHFVFEVCMVSTGKEGKSDLLRRATLIFSNSLAWFIGESKAHTDNTNTRTHSLSYWDNTTSLSLSLALPPPTISFISLSLSFEAFVT